MRGAPYTKEQLAFVRALRYINTDWKTLRKQFNDHFRQDRTIEGIRSAYYQARNKGQPEDDDDDSRDDNTHENNNDDRCVDRHTHLTTLSNDASEATRTHLDESQEQLMQTDPNQSSGFSQWLAFLEACYSGCVGGTLEGGEGSADRSSGGEGQ